MTYALPFTELASMIDQPAVEGCLRSGMIVLVEVNPLGFIEGIISAHTSVEQAFAAYQPVEMHDNVGVIIPADSSKGDDCRMFTCWLTRAEFEEAARG